MSNQPQSIHRPPIRLRGDAGRKLLASTPLKGLGGLMEKFLLLDHLDRICIAARELGEETSFFTRLLKCLELSCDCSTEDRQRIPAQGPVVVVANHPFGLAEGPALGSLLLGVRSDIRFLANSLLMAIPELREYVIPVDPFGGDGATQANLKPLRDAIEWLRRSGLLVVFPAGEVSSLQLPRPEIRDSAWNESVVRLVRITGSIVVPIFFHGANSAAFHIAGLAHPRLRTVLLPRELLNKKGMAMRVSIGRPIRAQALKRFQTSGDGANYLRERTQLLQLRSSVPGKPSREEWAFPLRWKQAPITQPIDSRLLRAEIEQLPRAQTLLTCGDYLVCVAGAEQIPKTMLEIGRLREITFRQAGEGTGSALDIDTFDSRYRHLVVWNQDRDEVAGAYRMVGTDAMLSRFGPRGLYTTTLFRFKPDFLPRIDPALELGRSFVRPEYQKSYLPLLLLWKGIGRFVVENPRYRMLFGPISISREYSAASRALMVAFLKAHCCDGSLAELVKPKSKFRAGWLPGLDLSALAPLLGNLEELSQIVADLEPDHKGVPVLLRQYLNAGGQILDFSVDDRFSNVLDGLVVVDLVRTDRRLLGRYLGEAGAEKFLSYHAGSTVTKNS